VFAREVFILVPKQPVAADGPPLNQTPLTPRPRSASRAITARHPKKHSPSSPSRPWPGKDRDETSKPVSQESKRKPQASHLISHKFVTICSPTPSWGWRISGSCNMKHLTLFKTITDEIKSQVDDPGQMELL
jgi:hypothetical protein